MLSSPFAAVNGDVDYQSSSHCQQNLIPFLQWLLGRHRDLGGVTEIRAIAEKPCKMIWSGYFDPDHLDDLVEQILPDENGPRRKIPFGETPFIGEANFYFSMQPVNPDLLARTANELVNSKTTSSDADVIAYHLFAVDVDPVRLSGISSTNEEKKEARKVAKSIRTWFEGRGMKCIFADSGNGYHLLVPTVRYDDVTTASANARTLLALLDRKFSTERAKVDTTIYNPGRILKLYGTKSVKGSDLPKRPHRYAGIKLKTIPDDVDLFEILQEDLTSVSNESQNKPQAGRSSAKRRSMIAEGEGWDAETSCSVLQEVLERSGLAFRTKQKEGDHFFEFQECPYHTDPDGHTYECCVIVRSDGSFAAKCQHEADAGWKDFKPLIGWDEHMKAPGSKPKLNQYKEATEGLTWYKPSIHAPVPVPLTNFTARITRQVFEDDGVERRLTFEMEASLGSQKFQFSLTAQDFSAMNWPIEHLGAQAVVYPGQSVKEHTRTAIQLLSEDPPRETVYTHLGWRQHGNQWVYLHAGGAIDRRGSVKDVRVKMSEPLNQFNLPEIGSPEELVQAVRTSLKFLDLAPASITFPLFAAVFRTAICGPDFSLHLVGQTGHFKTALSVLVQQFWGRDLTVRKIPASWKSTANTNEALAFLAKDAILLVDDFAPSGSSYDIQRAHREADHLLRGQGNSSGRGRMRPDATLRPPKPPRGLILSTGEDIPRGQSLRARVLVQELPPGSVDLEQLTDRQNDAAEGLYAIALSGFVRWLARHYNFFRNKMMPLYLPKFRDNATTSGQHRRTPNIVSDLYFGLVLFTFFAEECGAITQQEKLDLWDRGWDAFGEAAAAQNSIQGQCNPVQRFLELLNAAMTAGKAHVADTLGGKPEEAGGWGWRKQDYGWRPCGDRVGWIDGPSLYLEPEAAFAVVQRMANEGGEPLPVSSKTLHKRMKDQGLLVSIDEKRQRLLIRKNLENKQRAVLHLRAAAGC